MSNSSDSSIGNEIKTQDGPGTWPLRAFNTPPWLCPLPGLEGGDNSQWQRSRKALCGQPLGIGWMVLCPLTPNPGRDFKISWMLAGGRQVWSPWPQQQAWGFSAGHVGLGGRHPALAVGPLRYHGVPMMPPQLSQNSSLSSLGAWAQLQTRTGTPGGLGTVAHSLEEAWVLEARAEAGLSGKGPRD